MSRLRGGSNNNYNIRHDNHDHDGDDDSDVSSVSSVEELNPFRTSIRRRHVQETYVDSDEENEAPPSPPRSRRGRRGGRKNQMNEKEILADIFQHKTPTKRLEEILNDDSEDSDDTYGTSDGNPNVGRALSNRRGKNTLSYRRNKAPLAASSAVGARTVNCSTAKTTTDILAFLDSSDDDDSDSQYNGIGAGSNEAIRLWNDNEAVQRARLAAISLQEAQDYHAEDHVVVVDSEDEKSVELAYQRYRP